MADFQIGDTITDTFFLSNEAFTGGATGKLAYLALTQATKPGGTWTATLTEIGNGVYRVTANAPIADGEDGIWTYLVTYTEAGKLNSPTFYPAQFTVTDPASDAQTIAAAVLAASVTGGAAGSVAAKLNEIGTTTVDATVPIEANPSTIPVIRGDTYSNTIGTAIDFTSTDWPELTGATITMEIATINGTSYSLPMTVVTPTGTAEVRLEMTSATTAAFPVFVGRYEVVATLTGPATATLASGTFYAKD